MYTLIANLLGIPDTYANSTVSYISGALVVIFSVVLIDLIYRLIKGVFGRSQY